VKALRNVVALVAVLGIVAQLTARALVSDAGPVVAHEHLLGGVPPLLLAGLLLLLAIAGDLTYVPVRRGEETEELTLYEAAVVVAVLILPAREALWVPLAAVALISLLLRRPLLKSLFNVGIYSTATAVLVVIVHRVSGAGHGLDWRTVVALLIGLLAFSAVNLVGLTRVLTLIGEADAKQVLSDGARLALVTAAGTLAMTGSGVLAATHAPALLPFCLVPAVALLYAFRATAHSAEQRQRSARLLALSHVLAGRVEPDEMLPAFLSECRQTFGAETAYALIDPGVMHGHERALTAVDDRVDGASQRVSTEADRALLSGGSQEARVLTGPLPHGWLRAVVAPLEADGTPLGMLVLATRDKSRQLGTDELTLVTPLASALAVALRGAAHLQQLTEESSKLQDVVDQSSEGILVLDGEGRVQLWSPALAALSGRHAGEALGHPLGSLIRTTDQDGVPCDPFEVGRALLSPAERRATVELTLQRMDGELRVVRCAHAGVFAEDKLVRDVVIVHDVTRERQVERLKADFIATVSHELRTPVTPIKGYADLLRRRGDQMSAERRNECLEVISDRCDHLGRLVEDLLLASRISATEGVAKAQVDLGVGDLVSLVARAAGDFGTEGSRLQLDLPDGPAPVTCDPMRVIQVLTNLIGNALKYDPSGSPVTVRLVNDTEQAHVEVTDQGRGIPADQLEQVFEKFHRVEDPMRMTTGGTGLGLYIARQLATAMGGRLSCTSTLGEGSTFRFSLPLVPADAPLPTGTQLVPDPRGRAAEPGDARIQAC
jgi:PAS domain S-box-containing protein